MIQGNQTSTIQTVGALLQLRTAFLFGVSCCLQCNPNLQTFRQDFGYTVWGVGDRVRGF